MKLTALAFEKSLFETLGVSPNKPMYVGFSGGRDSTVLLHLMVQISQKMDLPLTALHVNHNINENALVWVEHCENICSSWNVPLRHTAICLLDNSEETARDARYKWFSQQVEPNAALLTAHHEQDRVETLLFNLMRGSGLKGMVSLRAVSPFKGAQLVRPLLEFSVESIAQYAEENALYWVEDSSNQALHYSRNFIRHRVIPSLLDFREDAVKGIARAAQNLEQEEALLREVAIRDLVEVRELNKSPIDSAHALCIEDIQNLSSVRKTNLIRLWLSSLKLHIPSRRFMLDVLDAIHEGCSGTAILQEGGCQFRFYESYMYVMPEFRPEEKTDEVLWNDTSSAMLLYQDTLEVHLEDKARTLLHRISGGQLYLVYRDNIRDPKSPSGHSLNLKKWFNESKVPPWRRYSVPVLVIRKANTDTVLSVADQYVQNDWLTTQQH